MKAYLTTRTSAVRVAAGVLALGVASFGGAGAAGAGVLSGLTNTGVDVDPTTLVDRAWSIVSGSSSPKLTYPSAVYADAFNGQFPIDGHSTPRSTSFEPVAAA